MTRERRLELIRRTTSYVAAVVQTLPMVDNGLWTPIGDDDVAEEEENLINDTVQRISEAINKRVSR